MSNGLRSFFGPQPLAASSAFGFRRLGGLTGSFTDMVAAVPGVFFNPVTENYYEAVATKESWTHADDAANGRGYPACTSHLATITSLPENDFIVTNMPQVAAGTPAGGGYWIGGFQPDGSVEPGGGWMWVNGEGAIPDNGAGPFENWADNEPNNSGNIEDSMQFKGNWGADPNKVRWNDEPGARPYGYVVEYECGS